MDAMVELPVLPSAEIERRLLASGLFDPDWYRQVWADVAESGMDPLGHFMRHGMFEGRDPGPEFNTRWYAVTYASEIPEGVLPCLHYLSAGMAAGCATQPPAPPVVAGTGAMQPDFDTRLAMVKATSLFDVDYYLATNADVARSNGDPYQHFVGFGSRECRPPSEAFDPVWYRNKYLRGTEDSDAEPLFHYLTAGRGKGYLPKPANAYLDWRDVYHSISEGEGAVLAARVRAGLGARELLVILRPGVPGSAVAVERCLGSLAVGFGAGFEGRFSICCAEDDALDPYTEQIRAIGGTIVAPAVLATIGAGDRDAVALFLSDAVEFRPFGALLLIDAALSGGRDLLYSDFEVLDGAGAPEGYFMPGFSPRLFGQLTRAFGAVVVSASLVRRLTQAGAIGCPMEALLALPASEQGGFAVGHVAEITHTNFSVLDGAGERRQGPLASTGQTVTIIVPTRDQVEVLRPCIDSVRRMTDYDPALVRIVVVDNQSEDEKTLDYLSEILKAGIAEVLRFNRPFNYSAINNMAAARFPADVFVFLNNDTVIIDPMWI